VTDLISSSLLSSEESVRLAKPPVCWSADEHLQVHMLLTAAFERWRVDWGLPVSEKAVMTALTMRQAQRAVQIELFGPDSGEVRDGELHAEVSVAQTVAANAWLDWVRRLELVLGGPVPFAEKPIRTEGDIWHDQLNIQLNWWNGMLYFALPEKIVRNLLGVARTAKGADAPASMPVVPLLTAAANAPVQLRAQFEPIALTLGQIQSLRFGDIVPLGHRLDDPITLSVDSGGVTAQRYCQAWLGHSEARIAVELCK